MSDLSAIEIQVLLFHSYNAAPYLDWPVSMQSHAARNARVKFSRMGLMKMARPSDGHYALTDKGEAAVERIKTASRAIVHRVAGPSYGGAPNWAFTLHDMKLEPGYVIGGTAGGAGGTQPGVSASGGGTADVFGLKAGSVYTVPPGYRTIRIYVQQPTPLEHTTGFAQAARRLRERFRAAVDDAVKRSTANRDAEIRGGPWDNMDPPKPPTKQRGKFAEVPTWIRRYERFKKTGARLHEDGLLTRKEWKTLFDAVFAHTDKLRDFTAANRIRSKFFYLKCAEVKTFGVYLQAVYGTEKSSMRRQGEMI